MGVTLRLPLIQPESMTADQADLYQRLLGDERRGGPGSLLARDGGGGLAGPFNALLLSPGIGDRLQELGHALRFGSELTDRVREIVILTVAGTRQSDFEWAAHSRIGRRAGLTDIELEGIKSGSADFEDPAEQLAARLALVMVIERQVSDELYQLCVEQLGARAVFDISAMVGYYDLVALQLSVFGYFR